ncbi:MULTISPECIES: FKBP-type peptidyl-prolyl cis-trans isomerase [Actinokineospora]|uniref:Peptidyl-prolyl cis-trans isomerase n=1 Tax=Actinokineospora fastidiosa TaxID=1816 RepID=A0A918GEX2_9PSEU|nr:MULTISPECIES: FKBP-type peptidyl-prolyl cis-trans isomerase [Actinokineospora]UVS80121.1 FK506-binding protein [Actinokineospora sp. UTMC 2448]GGS33196.1 peptidyl-prolyl cis-trans isomerase [Actinokineospora fastidiosa]
MRILGPTVATALLAALTACGQQSAPGNEPTLPESPTTEIATAVECTADDITVEGEAATKPKVTLPDTCSPPTKLLSKDLTPGSGAEAEQGDTVLAHYHLTTWSNRQVLDNSWDRGEPFPVANLGNARVIDGWNEGLVGIKQGARRLLVVPPDKGYGPGGNGVAPDETLVFVIDAVAVTDDSGKS